MERGIFEGVESLLIVSIYDIEFGYTKVIHNHGGRVFDG